MELTEFQTENGLHFHDPALLQQALTHRSYVNEHDEADLSDNERLEFLGDAVLDFISGEMLYRRFPDMPEGDLTRLRAALVRTESLAALAVKCRLGEALRMGKGEEKGGGRERPNNLCGGFEAVIGALYLDQGLEAVRTFVHAAACWSGWSRCLPSRWTRMRAASCKRSARRDYNLTPIYRLVDAFGTRTREGIHLRGADRRAGRSGSGVGRSKQAASQAAAQDALDRLESGVVD